MLDSQSTRRLQLLAWAALVWVALLAGRLIYLEVFQHDELARLARSQQTRVVKIEPPRGMILDRTGQPLALSLPVDSVCVNPSALKDAGVAAEILASVLKLDKAVLLERIRTAAENHAVFLWVKRKITPEESARLRSLKLEWIEFKTESKRFYPDGELAAHVLGGLGIVNKDDTEEHGNAGVELSFDEELRGRPGRIQMMTDVKRQAYEERVAEKPEPGENLTLAVDSRIQYVAERELKAAVEDHHAETGSIVVMDPRNGDVLALANYPTYDPNRPPAPGEPPGARSDLAVSTPFEPGSVFKVVTLSTALETTNLRPTSIIPCGNGVINLFGRVIHDHSRYSALSMAEVLAHSSNIGAIQIGLRAGDRNMYEYIRRFGFGRPTGIPLPGESGGMVRKLPAWSRSSIGSVAMGHEVSTTTLQLAQACSVVANGGLLVRPRLVVAKQQPGGELEKNPPAKPVRVLRPETAITMRQMMEGVVLHGTGRRATLPGYTSGGKTGSAQIYDLKLHEYTHKYNGSYMGFAPVQNPAVVIVVALNGTSGGNAGFGGVVAAPVFREVATAALRILDVPKDLPMDLPEPRLALADADDLPITELSQGPDPASSSASSASNRAISSVNLPPVRAGAGDLASSPGTDRRTFSARPEQALVGPRAPNFRGMTMRMVLEESTEIGVPVEVSGSGLARAQAPAAGTILAPGERIRVQFVR